MYWTTGFDGWLMAVGVTDSDRWFIEGGFGQRQQLGVRLRELPFGGCVLGAKRTGVQQHFSPTSSENLVAVALQVRVRTSDRDTTGD